MKLDQLEFASHITGMEGMQATAKFTNGYTASIITGTAFYTTDDKPFELAILAGGKVVYDTPITEDVCGYLTEDDVNKLLLDIEKLPQRKKGL